MNKKELKQLTLDDLKRSGLDSKDFKKMDLYPFDSEQTSNLLGYEVNSSSYMIPYFNIDGELHEPPFNRFRFLEEERNSKGKVVRYSQPKGTGIKLFFPPCVNWKKIASDTSITICITEGEKKAYKATKEGIPTIGLGGVNSFVDKYTKELIEDFKDINFKNRKVLICYDNDLHSNPEVNKASYKLAGKLFNEGAEVFNKLIPFDPYHKIGMDDYLLENSVEDFNELEEKPFCINESIDKLNNEVAYIRSVGKYYIFKDELFCNLKLLKDTVYSTYTTMGERGEPISVAHNWNASKQRREHTRLTYKPASPQVTEDNEYNLWRGMGCEPEKGSVKPFMDVVNKIFDKDKELIQWFLDWVAYPIQHPPTKMLNGVLIISVEQGTGKSSLGLCIGAMYGNNFNLVDDTQLHSDFNEWAINKQFILGDEISGKDKRAESDKIKNLITRPTITINKKMQPTYSVPDYMNYFFTSNHPDALSIEPTDRRFFVHRIKKGNGITTKQGESLEKFRLGNGKKHLLNYFLNEHKISKRFNPKSTPPMTEAKEDLQRVSLTDVESFVNDIKEYPDNALASKSGVPIDSDLYTASDLVKIYESQSGKSCYAKAMGNAIRKIFNYPKRYITKTLSGSQGLYALRNADKWEKATHQERQEHYDKSRLALQRAKSKDKKSKIR